MTTNERHGHRTDVWAQLLLSGRDVQRVQQFFVDTIGARPHRLIPTPHLTVYHARRPMRGLKPMLESANVVLPAEETRFMVLAPGGENPKPHLNPAKKKVGVRIHKQSTARNDILRFRDRLLKFESSQVLGSRPKSTHRRTAFGARMFQPHVALLKPGSRVDRDLRTIGVAFREAIDVLVFDRFEIKIDRIRVP